MKLKAIVLAAGQGTRMKSNVPKVMHSVCNLPMIEYVVSGVERILDTKPVLVVGHKAEDIIDYLGERADFVFQKERLGTGHAVMVASEHISENDIVFIVCGDTPLIKDETIACMKEKILNKDAVVLTSKLSNPFGYGRVIQSGNLLKIIEEKDATIDEKQITTINAGTYMIRGKCLLEALKKINNNNSQNEYYLTDIFNFLNDVDIVIADNEEILGINSRSQLATANKILRCRINELHMENGVTIIDPESTYIDKSVSIGADTVIYPNVHLRGNTKIGENCIIYENSTINSSVIDNNVVITSSQIVDSVIGSNTSVGPFAYLRPGAILGRDVKIGDFVEVKNATIGDGSKASHLSYVGDATVGKNVNIGCGTVFVNYDGKNKFKSVVNDNAFIGSNSNIIAPVTVGENAYIATGTTVTLDIPNDALCIGRSRETIKNNWGKK